MVSAVYMTRNKIPIHIPDRPDLSFETPLWEQKIFLVAGLDEAGRGAWAGPVAAGVVILTSDPSVHAKLDGVNDSKKLSAAQREHFEEKIKRHCQAWGVGVASSEEIDRIGILPATRLAMKRAIDALAIQPQHLLIDYLVLPEIPIPQTPLVKGDARSLSIACASILAKTHRDAFMKEQDGIFPGFGFASHKGYGTRRHMAAIQQYGSCPIHRLSFRPLQQTLL